MQSHRFDFDGIDVHYVEAGSGEPLLMIHGSGPGASTQGNWSKVLGPLAEHHHVFAMDLAGFGQSGRKSRPPYFDMPLWLAQCQAMLARMPAGPVNLIGHSISGALALKLAARESRVARVMTTGCMGAVFQPNAATLDTWTFPRDREALRRTASNLIHDASLIDEAYLANREKVLFSGDYAEYFGRMFEGDKRRFIDQSALSAEELGRIGCEVLMVHGREDTAFPPALTLALAQSLPQADVVLLGRCSHSVAFEFPSKFVALAQAFLGTAPRAHNRAAVPASA